MVSKTLVLPIPLLRYRVHRNSFKPLQNSSSRKYLTSFHITLFDQLYLSIDRCNYLLLDKPIVAKDFSQSDANKWKYWHINISMKLNL